MKTARYNRMCLVTSAVKHYLHEWMMREHRTEPVFCEYNDSLDYMFNKRFDRDIWLRPYVCAMLFKQFGKLYNDDSQAIINPAVLPALAVSEVFNISTYQSNIIFDDKIKNETISNVNQFISSFVSFNIAVQILQDIDAPKDKILECISILNDCNKKVYEGQFIDLNVLVAKQASTILSMPEDEYLNLYFERCRKIGGTTVDTCASWAFIVSGRDDKTELEKLRELFETWGQLMQMANDLSDFTVFINQKDYIRYTDIRAGKITLPFYFILSSMTKDSALSFVDSMTSYDDESLDAFFRKYLYKDSPVIVKVFSVMRSIWNKCSMLIKELGLDGEDFEFLFENAFLTKFSRCFFSNSLLKTI